jgi:hypothetical protein
MEKFFNLVGNLFVYTFMLSTIIGLGLLNVQLFELHRETVELRKEVVATNDTMSKLSRSLIVLRDMLEREIAASNDF